MARAKTGLRIKGKLEPEQIDRLLDKLDFSSLCYERLVTSRRSAKRHVYRAPVVVQIKDNDDDVTIIAAARNLSSSGMAFLVAGQIPTGTECTVRLTSLNGEAVNVRGQVLHCRQVEGQCEIGLRFEEPIDVSRFCDVAPESRK